MVTGILYFFDCLSITFFIGASSYLLLRLFFIVEEIEKRKHGTILSCVFAILYSILILNALGSIISEIEFKNFYVYLISGLITGAFVMFLDLKIGEDEDNRKEEKNKLIYYKNEVYSLREENKNLREINEYLLNNRYSSGYHTCEKGRSE